MQSSHKAKGIQQPADPAGQPLDGLSPRLESEVGASLERSLRLHKAETIAAECDRSRSTIYTWAAHPEHVPISALPILAALDPDPSFLPRVCGHLMASVSAHALATQATGRVVMILEELAPGRVVRR